MGWNERTKILVDEYHLLEDAHVLVAGLGGVGGIAAELLCRTGIGTITIVDCDEVSLSNRNRQLVALESTTGKRKTQVLGERLMDINPKLNLNVVDEYLVDEKIGEVLDHYKPSYLIDAIDTLTPKAQLIRESLERKIMLVSSMGSGSKFDPSLVEIKDISKTHKCPLARRLRERLRAWKIYKGFYAVFSPEDFDKSKFVPVVGEENKKNTVGTMSYMTTVFGCHCVSVIVRLILGKSF